MFNIYYILIIYSVHAIISEKISLAATHDGGLENLEIKGDMILKISDPNSTRLRIQLDNSFNRNFQFKVNINLI